MEERDYSRYFKAIGDPTRLRIVTILADREYTVNDIVARIGLSQPTVSRHLAKLRDAGVLDWRREGQQVFYRLNKESVRDCCAGFCDCLMIQLPVEKKKGKKQGK